MRILALAFLTTLLPMNVGIAQAPTANQLLKLGGLSAENGNFAIRNSLVTAYSNKDISLVKADSDKNDLLVGDGGAVTYEIKNTGMRSVTEIVPLEFSNTFNFCDSEDQVSKWIVDAIRKQLPKGAKVKETDELIDGHILVAYSVPRDLNSGLEVSLFMKTNEKYYKVGRSMVTAFGYYCGMLSITKDIRAVLVDEPSGSSDFSVIYFFAIKRNHVRK